MTSLFAGGGASARGGRLGLAAPLAASGGDIAAAREHDEPGGGGRGGLLRCPVLHAENRELPFPQAVDQADKVAALHQRGGMLEIDDDRRIREELRSLLQLHIERRHERFIRTRGNAQRDGGEEPAPDLECPCRHAARASILGFVCLHAPVLLLLPNGTGGFVPRGCFSA